MISEITPSPCWKLKLLYDGECPFCRREIAWMAQHNKKGLLAFEDITDPHFDPALYSLTEEEVMSVIHGIFHDGRVIKKVDVFLEAYTLLGLGWLLKPLSWPLIHPIATFFYELFAHYRLPLGKLFGRSKCPSHRCEFRK